MQIMHPLSWFKNSIGQIGNFNYVGQPIISGQTLEILSKDSGLKKVILSKAWKPKK
jgi:hypothetical protein